MNNALTYTDRDVRAILANKALLNSSLRVRLMEPTRSTVLSLLP